MRKAVKILLFLMLLELFLGGGGRLLEIGPITVRMVLFAVAVPLSILLSVYHRRLKRRDLQLLVLFFLLTTFSSLVGLANGAALRKIAVDVKPLLFFALLPFFSYTITSLKRVKQVSTLIKGAALFMAVAYLVAIYLLYSGQVGFEQLYDALDINKEFSFRGTLGFFYKGFLYMCIGMFFFFREKKLSSRAIVLLLGIAVFLTYTRGFVLALLLTFAFYAVFVSEDKRKTFALAALAMVFLVPAVDALLTTLGDKSASDHIRIVQTQQVFARMSIPSLLFGHGFGVGVPIRRDHMEIAFLEIFHKQGLLGLAFWSYLLYKVFAAYQGAVRNGFRDQALPYFLAALFVYLQSVTNPFVNNPIGMSMVMLALVSLSVLGHYQPRLKKNDIRLYAHL